MPPSGPERPVVARLAVVLTEGPDGPGSDVYSVECDLGPGVVLRDADLLVVELVGTLLRESAQAAAAFRRLSERAA